MSLQQLMSVLGSAAIPMVLAATDLTPSGSAQGGAPSGNVTSNSTTVSVVSGGTGPFTYAWTQGPGGVASGGPFTADTPAVATTTFSDGRDDTDPDNDEEWTCTVTDALLDTETIVVLVTLEYEQL